MKLIKGISSRRKKIVDDTCLRNKIHVSVNVFRVE